MNWNFVCLTKEEGGLGVRRLREFNVALLGKWCWRMLVDKEGLWYRVLKARYGEEGGQLKEGRGDSSVWWRMLSSIRSGVGLGEGSWFEENIRKVVGGGGSTYFWLDNWVGGVPLSVRFPCLFALAENKEVTVREMSRRGWMDGGDAWTWRRRLLAWEEELVMECSGLWSPIVLQDYVLDRWRWILDPINGYSVKGTYEFLTLSDTSRERGIYDAAWLKHVPLRVSIFVWRLLRNRLPTKDNLVRRRVLHHDDIYCIGSCGVQESTCHLFFRCTIFGGVWHMVYQWLDISFIPPNSVFDHLHQFGHMAGLPRYTHSFFRVIWHACVWSVWKERNNKIFKDKAEDLAQLLGKVKFMSFS